MQAESLGIADIGTPLLDLNHGLINYKDTEAKCRHLKKLTCKGTLRQVFISLWTGDTVGHVSIFDPALRTVAPLIFSLVQLSPLPPFPLQVNFFR